MNNAISAKGNVVQSVGDENTIKVELPKESIWAALWEKVKAGWKWLVG